MNNEKIAGYLSLMLVGAFLFTTTVIAIAPVLTARPSLDSANQLKDYWGVFSGVIGVVIGYYFGSKNTQIQAPTMPIGQNLNQ